MATAGMSLRRSSVIISALFRNASRQKSTISHQLVVTQYGDPIKSVSMAEEPLPSLNSNEVKVRMLATTVNPADINTIQGSYAVKPNIPFVGGNEGVGEVIEVGSDVTQLKVGDKVLPAINAWGTWRTYAVCPQNHVFKINPNLSPVEATTMSVNPCTAYRMLKDFVSLKSGDVVIQNGANSAVGQSVIQMCKAWGLKSVNIVRNRPNIEELKRELQELGAHVVLTEEELRTTEVFKSKQLSRPLLGLNCVGGKNALEVTRQLGNKGTMVTYGGMSREPLMVPVSALIFKDQRFVGYWMTRWNKENQGNENWENMYDNIATMIIEKKLAPPKHKLVPFTQFKEAIENALSPKGFIGYKYILDMQK
ncbi:enoyl-[acyl-carrier-protein] reductase, mitochondrial [Cloeon dipterum]|uniref:enoyl-[acyl-carrier-protein] reductase, mitochondrial n=1 Tax=Cloeon dipterum TaxID=197152 RepID=UPI00321FDAD9